MALTNNSRFDKVMMDFDQTMALSAQTMAYSCLNDSIFLLE